MPEVLPTGTCSCVSFWSKAWNPLQALLIPTHASYPRLSSAHDLHHTTLPT